MTNTNLPDLAREVSAEPEYPTAYSICTLVTQPDLYRRMVESFINAGFTLADCEYLCIDNTGGNTFDAYHGLNHMIRQAKGRTILLCHQDLLAIDSRDALDDRLAELGRTAPGWAVAGNAGYDARRGKHVRITHRYGINENSGDLPAEVVSLDENFLVLRAATRVGLSNDLSGFHLYGTDLVTQARLAGHSAWVVDYHVEHLGHGTVDRSFLQDIEAFEVKYARALAPRNIRTPVTKVALGKADLESRFRRWKLRYQLDKGVKPLWWLKRFDFRRRKLMADLRDLVKGPRYRIDGATLTIPPGAPPQPRKALRRGTYEGAERRLVAKYLPPDLPVIELGGSYGVVSHAIRSRLQPGTPQIIVEANPALIDYCRNNAAVAGSADSTEVLNAAVAYTDDGVVRFEVTEGIHDSRLSGGGATGGAVIEAKAITLSDLLRRHDITGPYSLVCDIEGAELDLLENETQALKSCACVVMELHPPAFIESGASVSRVMELIDAAGLQVVEQSDQVIAALPS